MPMFPKQRNEEATLAAAERDNDDSDDTDGDVQSNEPADGKCDVILDGCVDHLFVGAGILKSSLLMFLSTVFQSSFKSLEI